MPTGTELIDLFTNLNIRLCFATGLLGSAAVSARRSNCAPSA